MLVEKFKLFAVLFQFLGSSLNFSEPEIAKFKTSLHLLIVQLAKIQCQLHKVIPRLFNLNSILHYFTLLGYHLYYFVLFLSTTNLPVGTLEKNMVDFFAI